MTIRLGVLCAFALVLPSVLTAQAGGDPGVAEAGNAAMPRLSWTSDRLPLRVGDLVTIVVDENTLASERNSVVARSTRSQDASIASSPVDGTVGIAYGAQSDNTGKADRSGRLAGVVSVRVITVEPGGLARVEGRKSVIVDGRTQELLITGLVRAEDVSPANTVLSSRVAEAVITYKGKKLGPSTGIIGKLLGLLWP